MNIIKNIVDNNVIELTNGKQLFVNRSKFYVNSIMFYDQDGFLYHFDENGIDVENGYKIKNIYSLSNNFPISEKTKEVCSMFIVCLDGCFTIDPLPQMPSSYEIGLTKLEYDETSNELNVHCRKSGLLIGYHSEKIKRLEEYLKVKIVPQNSVLF